MDVFFLMNVKSSKIINFEYKAILGKRLLNFYSKFSNCLVNRNDQEI